MANSEKANPEKEKMISMHTFSSLYCQGPNNLPTVANGDFPTIPIRGMAVHSTAGSWGSAPAEFLHGPSGIPDFRHLPDLFPVEIHHIDVVCRRALAGWRTWAALTGMGG
jgi:hypothetical protein